MMTIIPRDRVTTILCLNVLAGTCLAIYDPSVTTVKPPNRRESVLPWYLGGDESPPVGDLFRSAKRPGEQDESSPRQPVIINAGSDSWTPWRKTTGSEIEQRTVIGGSRAHESNIDQHHELEQTQFNQYDELLPPLEGENQRPVEPSDKPSWYEALKNVALQESKRLAKDSKGNKLYVEVETGDTDLYEGVENDSKKPRKEKILVNTKPKWTVAKYNPSSGVQCPDPDATGQFVYPLDCKFFVNCWQGRAFVQPCAPGTLFNPETLECDFPHKVNCYGGELAEFETAEVWEAQGRRQPLRSGKQVHSEGSNAQQDLRCPPQMTGMLPHPTDCTKFLQCANGGTIVMDCGPGTVFNPAVNVCDWPNNVRGCEDATKSDDEDHSLVPPNPDNYGYSNEHGSKAEYNAHENANRISCPPDFSGLLPHPDTCYKFLQCDHGRTFITDCGPGTAFNPAVGVCDWPYNVPSCNEEKWTSSQDSGNTGGTWSQSGTIRYNRTRDQFGRGFSSSRQGNQGSWQDNQGNQGSWKLNQGSGQGSWQSGQNEYVRTTTSSSRPTWRPTWRPNYNPQGQQGQYGQAGTNQNGPYGNLYDHRQKVDHYQHPGTEDPSQQNQGHHFNGHQGSWQHNHHGYHNGHHDPSYHHDHQFGKPGNEGTPDDSTGSYSHGYHVESQTPAIEDQLTNPERPPPPQPYPHHHHYDYHHHDHSRPWKYPHHHQSAGSTGDDRQVPTSGFEEPATQYNENTHGYHHPDINNNRTNYGGGNSWPGNRRIDENSSNNRQNYGRTKPNFPYPGSSNPSGPDGNVYVDNGYNVPHEIPRLNQTRGNSNWNYGSHNGPARNRTTWSQPEMPGNRPGVFRPNTWPGQPGHQGQSWNLSQSQPWNQDSSKMDDKRRQWSTNTNVHQQSTTDREADSKMNQWAGNTNIFQQSRGKVGPGVKTTSPDSKRPLYPNGVYVNVNGTKGHYITKEIEITQGHSQTRTYGRNDPDIPGSFNRTYGNTYRPAPPPYNRPFNYPTRPGTRPTDLEGSGSHYPVVIDRGFPGSRGDPGSTGNKDNLANPATRETFASRPVTFVPSRALPRTTTEAVSEEYSTTTDPNVPSVSIEDEDEENSRENGDREGTDTVVPTNSNSQPKFTEAKPEVDQYDVDLLEDKKVWKPRLVYENKTKTTTPPSVIMRIGRKKKTDVNIFNAEAAPLVQEEPPFPVYFIPPVQPLFNANKSRPLTPISGQIIRLRGGHGPGDGYLEVQGIHPGWGIVCDSRNGWTLKEAHVVCKQLGYSRGAEMAWQGRNNQGDMPSWIAADSVSCTGNETFFQTCKFTHEQNCRVERDAVGVRCLPNRVVHCRKDEVPHEGQCYHLADPESGLNHAEALEYCSHRNARLIDVTNQAENNFVSEWMTQKHPEIASVMTSGVGFTMYNRTLWLWEDSSKAKFKFSKWWPGWMSDQTIPPWVGTRPACIIMKRKFPCHERPDSICIADYFFWDIEDCAANMKGHSYICKRPYDDVGCVYGKGNQYAGNANVTASGADCLPWKDEKVAHSLLINVVSRELREKLKTHNYCRNPNPYKESRPWCFAAPNGQREYCDIPSCGNVGSKRSLATGQCKPKHFECMPGECIPSPWVCDGEEDCTNGADERACAAHLNLFKKTARRRLDGHDVEKWLNTPAKTCALRCKEADFTCRSFAHKSDGNVCLLSNSNVGMTGGLKPSKEFDYYEMIERSMDCTDLFVCNNGKCINQTQVCNGKNDCNDRSDENICTAENLDYDIRLAGSNSSNEGRIEVKVLGHWGQVCDDGFGMINADVICKELGFVLGALEVRPGGFYGNLDPPTRFMVDQLKCRGNETSLRECDFEGWGVHNCQPEEAVGVVCKTAVDSCQEGHWKCDNSPMCIPTPFICDEVVDCPDGSDENSQHCDAPFELRLANGSSPMEGRVEIRHHGVWGTVCDDDFTNTTAAVICRSLGYGGVAIAKKNGYFGPGEGPIWLDEVSCSGKESQLYRCDHNHWGQHNCDHNEDAGVICTPGDVDDSQPFWDSVPETPELNINDILPADCGKRAEDFSEEEDMFFARVVQGSIAPRGTYPWQASIRVRGHSRSSHWCGAVILSPLHVLTAAHCLEGYNKGTYFVRAGDYHTEIDEGTEVEANIEDYYVHEKFRKGHRMNNDIALVLLKGRGIPLGKDIMPICLPPENTEYPPGLNCTISGFGSIETGKSTQSKDLRYGWIPLLEQSVCRADYVYGDGAITDGMVCAGFLDEGIDACDGDSGGPLACQNNGAFTLYGITSWGQHCGRANKPGVYVRVSHYRRWIDEKIKQSLSGR